MTEFKAGDKARVLRNEPNYTDLKEGDIVTVISVRDEGDYKNQEVYTTGADGATVELFPKRGWFVDYDALELVEEDKDGYVPIIGVSVAMIRGTSLGVLSEIQDCVRGDAQSDYKFSGPAGTWGWIHDPASIEWLVPFDGPTIDPYVKTEPIWEVGKRYVWSKDGTPGIEPITVTYVDEDGDAYGVKKNSRTGQSWKTVRPASDRKHYKESE